MFFFLLLQKNSNKTPKKCYQSLQSEKVITDGSCLLNNKRHVFSKNEMNIVNNLKSSPYNPVYFSSDTKIHQSDVHCNSKLYKFVKKILKRKLKYSKKTKVLSSSQQKHDIKLLCCDTNTSDDTMSTPLWYHEQLSRSTTTKILEQRPSGSFVVRKSSKRNCFALSLSVTNSSNFSSNKMKVIHFLILEANNGFKIKGSNKVFQSLMALVTHHSVMSETLPVTLLLPKSDDIKEYYVRRINRKVEDYDSFEQLRKVLEELELSSSSS